MSEKKKYCIENKEEIRIRNIEKHYEKNRKKRNAYNMAKYYENHEENKRKRRERNATEEGKKARRVWRKTYKLKHGDNGEKRRERDRELQKIKETDSLTCKKCNQTLSPIKDFFYKSKGMSTGYMNTCIKCFSIAEKKRRLENPELFRKRSNTFYVKNKDRRIEAMKKRYYADHEENKRKGREYSNRPENILRKKQYTKKYNENNKDKKKIYWENNKKRLSKARKIWAASKAGRATTKACHDRRYKSDPGYKAMLNIRSKINLAIKNNFKVGSSVELLGCSVDELKAHLESQFLPGMSWDNHTVHGWHMDHILPCSSFDLSDEEQQRKCFHYSNLQPLWAIDNLKKGTSMPRSDNA